MVGAYDLGKAFFDQRYILSKKGRHPENVNLPWNFELTKDKNFYTNTGAAQLFNSNNNPITNAIGGSSIPYQGTYGHSERILMRDVLDNMMKQDQYKAQGQLYNPSNNQYAKSNNPKDIPLEILQNLVNNAPDYKNYLEQNNAIVKMWSERNACKNNEAGGSCDQFLNNILPIGSHYGFLAGNDNNLADQSKKLATGYMNYKNGEPNRNRTADESKGNNSSSLSTPSSSSSSSNLSSYNIHPSRPSSSSSSSSSSTASNPLTSLISPSSSSSISSSTVPLQSSTPSSSSSRSNSSYTSLSPASLHKIRPEVTAYRNNQRQYNNLRGNEWRF